MALARMNVPKLEWTSNVPVLRINIDRLHSRQDPIRHMLRPLRDGYDVGCSVGKGKYAGGKIVAAHDAPTPSGDPRDWRFRTFVPGISGQYFELWMPWNSDRSLVLNRAYLHILQLNREKCVLAEILCLHSDPAATDNEPLRTYKRGPHLHVKLAEPPLPQSHFPLNLGHLEQVLDSVGSLTNAMRSAVEVISNEVLKRMAN